MSQSPSGAGPGQRNMSQPFFIPTLMPMHSIQKQQVMISSGVPPVINTPGFGQGAPTITVIQQPLPSANLYLCTTSKNATEPPTEDIGNDEKKVSINVLEESYKELNSRKVKDTLSSFLPDIPGEFDFTESPDTKLKHLLEQRSIGNKDFHPLSGHALLGFRLLPGALPEKFRIDPPSQEVRSHHRKKKHKHRSIEKGTGEEGSDFNPPSSKVKIPNDAYSFIKADSSSLLPPAAVHGYTTSGDRSTPTSIQKVVSSGVHSSGYPTVVPAPALVSGGPLVVTHESTIGQFPGGKKKKEKKRNKEKKKEKKEKKKKKEKHHSQDPPTGPTPSIHPPPTY